MTARACPLCPSAGRWASLPAALSLDPCLQKYPISPDHPYVKEYMPILINKFLIAYIDNYDKLFRLILFSISYQTVGQIR